MIVVPAQMRRLNARSYFPELKCAQFDAGLQVLLDKINL